jgi:hypothetical protein
MENRLKLLIPLKEKYPAHLEAPECRSSGSRISMISMIRNDSNLFG